MGWALDETEAQRVRALDDDARYAFAINTIREHEELWILESERGWVVNGFDEGASSISIWPYEQLAQLEAVGHAADARPVRVTLARWLSDRRAAWFEEKDLRVSVFPAGDSTITADYSTVAQELRGEWRARYPFARHGSGGALLPKRDTRGFADLVMYINTRETNLVLSRVPEQYRTRVRDIFTRRSSDAMVLGSVTRRGRRDITLSAYLPIRVSLRGYMGRMGSAEEFGAPKVGQWPPWAVRRYLLYDTLLHEVGHLQVVDANASNNNRKFASETRAQEFAAEMRRTLYSEHFDHPDPIHNAPTAAEWSALVVWERLDKTQRGHLVKLVLAAPNADTKELAKFGTLTTEQLEFLSRLITTRRG